MNPTNSSQGGDELGPAGSSTPQTSPPQDNRAAATDVIRSQIDALYGGRPVADRQEPTATRPYLQATPQSVVPQQVTQPVPQTQPQQPAQQPAQPSYAAQTSSPITDDDTNPYNRVHTQHPQPQAEQWKAYHSAWQTYYQKYYEAYYEHQKKVQAQQNPENNQPAQQATTFFADQVSQPGQAQQTAGAASASDDTQDQQESTKDQALFELRQKLLKKVSGRAQKIKTSKHFIPMVAALCVVLIFVFLQYNRVFIATVNAYVSPGSMDVQNIVIDPSADTAVSADPRLIIPKINVDVPAIYGIAPDNDSQLTAMEKGVAHFSIPGANSKPGEIGNTVLSGHSSNDLFDTGDYKFIFAQLEKLNIGDTIYANYEGKRYTYVVTKTQVVKPSQVSALVYPTDKPVLTLITCTPLGTARDRLLVTAEQISPDPSAAAQAPAGSGDTGSGTADIPGSSPTFLERLFGAR